MISAKSAKTLKKFMIAWVAIIVVVQVYEYSAGLVEVFIANRENNRDVQKISQSVTLALESKDMDSIYEDLINLQYAPGYKYSSTYSDLGDSIFNVLKDYPKFLPVVEKLVANGAYLKKSFPILREHFNEVTNPLNMYLAYADNDEAYHELMQMVVSTEDADLFREIYSRSRMKILDQFKLGKTTPDISLKKMQSLHSAISSHFPKDNHIQGWSRDSLIVISDIMRLITFYQDYNALLGQLDSVETDLKGWGDKMFLSGYIEKVWSTDENAETYLVSNSSLRVSGKYQRASSDCLLRMTNRRYTSEGRFESLEVFQYSTREVKSPGGFTNTIPVFEAWTESALSRFQEATEEASAIRRNLLVIERKLGFTPTKKAISEKLSRMN